MLWDSGFKRVQGFTLVELLVTVAIIAILASMAVPLVELTRQRAKEQELRTSLRQIRMAIDAYKQAVDDGKIPKKADGSGYPPSLEVLESGVLNAKSTKQDKIYFLRKLPRDPLSEDTDATPAETWGKRSYASRPDDPQPGDDVFDVYSKAEGTGLNGVSYRNW